MLHPKVSTGIHNYFNIPRMVYERPKDLRIAPLEWALEMGSICTLGKGTAINKLCLATIKRITVPAAPP